MLRNCSIQSKEFVRYQIQKMPPYLKKGQHLAFRPSGRRVSAEDFCYLSHKRLTSHILNKDVLQDA